MQKKNNFKPGANRNNNTSRKRNNNSSRGRNNNSHPQGFSPRRQQPEIHAITYSDGITVGELAKKCGRNAGDLIKILFMQGKMVTINSSLDDDMVETVCLEYDIEPTKVKPKDEDSLEDEEPDDPKLLKERPPIVTIMGHVDHGKTTLLDAIRKTKVAAGEAGGITQAIGAYQVSIKGRKITFLDTPGHEAFTAMRARGAKVTDIAVIVVAADDGVMPQTKEAIDHAKAADVPMMDKPGANPDRVKSEMADLGIMPEEWGGDTIFVPTSAKKGEGISDLLETILTVADMKELKANPKRLASGTVIEAKLDKGRGPVATVLVQNGTLHKGDTIIAGTSVGRVRVMTNDKGERVQEAGPSVPVEITGLDEVPTGGDVFDAVSDERLARTLVEQRKSQKKEEIFNAQTKVTLDNLFDQMKLGEIKELQIIVKADVQGSVEAVKQSLEKLSNEEVRVNVIHGAVGAINESDVMLAEASSAIIVGFNVRPDSVAADNAERAGVDMRLYSVIYDCINEIESAMKGMLAPKTREIVLGMAECRNVIKIKSVGTIAGSYVKSGKIQRGASVRVIRDGIVIADDAIGSLQRFKDAVKEVNEGYECGIGLEKFNDLKEGDMFEVYTIEEYRD